MRELVIIRRYKLRDANAIKISTKVRAKYNRVSGGAMRTWVDKNKIQGINSFQMLY